MQTIVMSDVYSKILYKIIIQNQSLSANILSTIKVYIRWLIDIKIILKLSFSIWQKMLISDLSTQLKILNIMKRVTTIGDRKDLSKERYAFLESGYFEVMGP